MTCCFYSTTSIYVLEPIEMEVYYLYFLGIVIMVTEKWEHNDSSEAMSGMALDLTIAILLCFFFNGMPETWPIADTA